MHKFHLAIMITFADDRLQELTALEAATCWLSDYNEIATDPSVRYEQIDLIAAQLHGYDASDSLRVAHVRTRDSKIDFVLIITEGDSWHIECRQPENAKELDLFATANQALIAA